MDVSTELAALSRTIDAGVLGQRIKTARIAAGLTQSELASPEASAAYLSRIESGDRRPELKLLLVFAAKVGMTLEQLLTGVTGDRQAELRTRIDRAAWALEHDGPAALAELRDITAALDGSPESDTSTEVALLTALAARAAGDLDDAIIRLEDLVEAGPTARHWLDAAVALTSAYVAGGDAGRAVRLGEQALATLDAAGIAGGDHALALATALSAAHVAQGDTDRALQALGRVPSAAAAPDLAAAYHRASSAELENANVHLARTFAATARRIGDDVARRVRAARHQAARGELLLAADEPDVANARAALERAVDMLSGHGSAAELAAVRTALARAVFLDGEPDAAVAILGADADADLSPVLAATRDLLLGQIQRRARKAKAAHESFARAADALRGVAGDRSAAQLWFELGSIFDELGDADASRDAYRRAAAATGLAATGAAAHRRATT
ncbi:helix-turn-helix domain-containing protein [Nocardioides daeguensis]|uniref:HTH cro/C1-type domain-containing protein n=1 Tax=Nocardioides daeguensis TaxID=908359 RepID=A0ABP6W8P3_9ACTN|nr:helix-turn-helix transcriptional regulator [Nocardioides daeguensis]MBV6727799.1 helix-turn-helix domain-containing protein [Nocardioides daeguensis]MCR1775270.1 helix-turn-helix domain-containing protein [Nocardioides daeguensis]